MLDRKVFAARLRELREANNMSCAALAEKIGVTGASLGYYERGERVPDIETAQKLCGVFGVTSDYLLGLSDTPSPDIEDQAICKKLGIEGETLEALKKIFYSEFDDPTPARVIAFWQDLDEVLTGAEAAEIFFQTILKQTDHNDMESNFFFCLKRYMLAVDNYLEVMESMDETFLQEADRSLEERVDTYILEHQEEIVVFSKEYHDANLHLKAASWGVQEALLAVLKSMRKHYEEYQWQA